MAPVQAAQYECPRPLLALRCATSCTGLPPRAALRPSNWAGVVVLLPTVTNGCLLRRQLYPQPFTRVAPPVQPERDPGRRGCWEVGSRRCLSDARCPKGVTSLSVKGNIFMLSLIGNKETEFGAGVTTCRLIGSKLQGFGKD